jgi:hypothetical protein
MRLLALQRVEVGAFRVQACIQRSSTARTYIEEQDQRLNVQLAIAMQYASSSKVLWNSHSMNCRSSNSKLTHLNNAGMCTCTSREPFENFQGEGWITPGVWWAQHFRAGNRSVIDD